MDDAQALSLQPGQNNISLDTEGSALDRQAILDNVLRALESANAVRDAGQQLEVSPTAPIFGAASPLDSLGLVALLIDIEESFANQGHTIVLSDDRALSQKRSPFRDVPSLVTYIEQLMVEARA
jgi:acyl carrier protein